MNGAIVSNAIFVVVQIFATVVSDDVTEVVMADHDTVIYKESDSKSNGSGEFLFAGQNGGGSARRSLVRFDLAKLPKNAVISKASLVLKISKANQGDSVIALHRLVTPWGEGKSDAAGGEGGGAQARAPDATWGFSQFPNKKWKKGGGDFTTEPSATSTVGKSGNVTWTSPQLTQDVQNWFKGESKNFGWILLGDESKPGTAKRFSGRSQKQDGPQLFIEYSIDK